MATLTLGDKPYALARPDDLAARLLASTGLGLVEARTMLVKSSIPALLARAVAPLLGADAPDEATLGELVAASDLAEIAATIAPFYADVPEPAPVIAAPAQPQEGNDDQA